MSDLSDVKGGDLGRVGLAELRERGILLEVNRRVLNPVGMALAAAANGAMFVERAAPPGGGGVVFGGVSGLLGEKAAAFRALEAQELPARVATHGVVIEPMPGEPPRTVRALGCDAPGVWAHVERLAHGMARVLAHSMPVDSIETFALLIPRCVVAPLLDVLALQSVDGGASWSWRVDGHSPVAEHGDKLARCAFLLSEIDRLQSGGDSPAAHAQGERGERVGDEIRQYVVSARGELYESEVEELEGARSDYVALTGRTVSDDTAAAFEADLDATLRELERLYGNAQPGMRVYRGDESAREAFNGHRERLRDAARSAVRSMSERERLDAGELGDFDEADWPALDADLRREQAEAVEECAEAERMLAAAIGRRESVQRGLAVVERAMRRRTA